MIRGPFILFVCLLSCAVVRAEGEATRLQTPQGQLEYLWQRQQEDPTGATTSLPPETLQQTLGAIGGKMDSARSVFQSASRDRWTWRPATDPPAELEKVYEQARADLAQLPLTTFTNPEDDWETLRKRPNGQSLRKAWLRLAPLLYGGFFSANSPLSRADAQDVVYLAHLPENLQRLRIAHVDYATDELNARLVNLKGMPKIDDAWAGQPAWKALMQPKLVDKTNITPQLHSGLEPWSSPSDYRPLVLRELPPGQYPNWPEKAGVVAAQRAAQYALVNGAKLYAVTRGEGGRVMGWVLATEAQFKQERERINGAEYQRDFHPYAAKQPYVIDARGMDGQPLAAEFLEPALHMVATAHGSPSKLVVSSALRDRAPALASQPVRADLPRGWMTIDANRRKDDPQNPYTDDALSAGHAITLNPESGEAAPYTVPQKKFFNLAQANEAEKELLGVAALDAGMHLAGSELPSASELYRARDARTLLFRLRAAQTNLSQTLHAFDDLSSAHFDFLLPELVGLTAGWSEPNRTLVAGSLAARFAEPQRLRIYQAFNLPPSVDKYAVLYAKTMRDIVDAQFKIDTLANKDLDDLIARAPDNLVQEMRDHLAKRLRPFLWKESPKPRRSDLLLGFRWTAGMRNFSSMDRPRQTDRTAVQSKALGYLLGHSSKWRSQDYGIALRLLRDCPGSWAVAEEVLLGLAGQDWPETQRPEIEAAIRTVLDTHWVLPYAASLSQRISEVHGKQKLERFAAAVDRLLLPKAVVPPGVSSGEVNRAAYEALEHFDRWQDAINRAMPQRWLDNTLFLHPDALAFLSLDLPWIGEYMKPALDKLARDLYRGEARRWSLMKGNLALVMEGNHLAFRHAPPDWTSNRSPLVNPNSEDGMLRPILTRRLAQYESCPFQRLGSYRPTRWENFKAELRDPRTWQNAKRVPSRWFMYPFYAAGIYGQLHALNQISGSRKEEELNKIPPPVRDATNELEQHFGFTPEESAVVGEELKRHADPRAAFALYRDAYFHPERLRAEHYEFSKLDKQAFALTAMAMPDPRKFLERFHLAALYYQDQQGDRAGMAEMAARSTQYSDDQLFLLGRSYATARKLGHTSEEAQRAADAALADGRREPVEVRSKAADYALNVMDTSAPVADEFVQLVMAKPDPKAYLRRFQVAFSYKRPRSRNYLEAADWSKKVAEREEGEKYVENYQKVSLTAYRLGISQARATALAEKYAASPDMKKFFRDFSDGYQLAHDVLGLREEGSIKWVESKLDRRDFSDYVDRVEKSYYYCRRYAGSASQAEAWALKAAERSDFEDFFKQHKRIFESQGENEHAWTTAERAWHE